MSSRLTPTPPFFPYTTLFRSRLVPWIDKTAMVICDIVDEDTGEPVEVAPRQILKRQMERAKRAGYVFKGGSELELDRKSTRLNSSHLVISYAVFCLKQKKIKC